MQTTVAAAHKLVEEVAAARGGRSIDHAVIEFTRLLATVPDSSASGMTSADLDRIGELAERVIHEIEGRLDGHNDPQAIQIDLAKAVYEIRVALEAIHRWRSHFRVG
jgi:hypothetical protein